MVRLLVASMIRGRGVVRRAPSLELHPAFQVALLVSLSFVRVFFHLPLRKPIMRAAEEEGVTYCTTLFSAG